MLDNNKISEFIQGLSLDAYTQFGAHFSHEYNQDGVRFTVYAPNALRIKLVGTFNDWSGYDMERLPSGVWTIFVNGVSEMSLYKYKIFTNDGNVVDKIDPFAFYSELRPNTASIVYNINDFTWSDLDWMNSRSKNFDSPMNIYEVHLGSWKIKNSKSNEFFNYNELSEMLIPYIKENGYTHIELMPITEYPYDGSWGYQVSGYFSATSRYGEPKDLMNFIDICHNEGIGVILDVVPTHFVKDIHALYKYDGSFVYESDDESKQESEWGTAIFDFTKPHVISFMKSSLDFWLSYYHFDGLRYDAVSKLVYVDGNLNYGINESGLWFLRNTNFSLQLKHPTAMLIAEDSSIYPKLTAPVVYGGVGFDYKWNFGWMHDTFDYFEMEPKYREDCRWKFMFSMDYFYSELFLLPISHDEVSYHKKSLVDRMYGSYDDKFSQLRCLFLFMFTHPGKKLNFMGNELGQFEKWNENKEIDWDILDYPKHLIFKKFLNRLHEIYLKESSLFKNDYNKNSFQWLSVDDSMKCVFAYKRDDLEGNISYIVLNLSPNTYTDFRLNVHKSGDYDEIINTDDKDFDGNGIVNTAKSSEGYGNDYYLNIVLAPFTGLIMKNRN